MQLKMPFPEVAAPPPPTSAASVTTSPRPIAAWDQLDETARIAALGVLARLIARMLAAKPEAHHE